MSQCHATCCVLPTVDQYAPYCSEECRKLTGLIAGCRSWEAKRTGDGQYLPPPIGPWSWLDARAAPLPPPAPPEPEPPVGIRARISAWMERR